MKTGIHPKYNTATKVTCACGNTFSTGSTLDEINVEICSKCHPFWSGEEKVLDTQGRVDRFKRRATKTADKKTTKSK
jgi:large subunit ribosomal protein L31